MIFDDAPILRLERDELDRSGFAMAIARSIDGLSVAGNGFVMALLGEWGSGKTSVLEMVLRSVEHFDIIRCMRGPGGATAVTDDELRSADKDAGEFAKVARHALEFPESSPSLRQSGLQKIEFRRHRLSENEVVAAERHWSGSMMAARSGKTVIVRFSPWLVSGQAQMSSALMTELARVLGFRLGPKVATAFAALMARLHELAPLTAVGVDLMSGGAGGRLMTAVTHSGSKFAAQAVRGQTLDDLRVSLRDSLATLQDKKVLVAIDDLDRLNPQETLEMISVVKALGDLPNTIYLLAYDEERLVQNLKRANVDKEFLEKVVQHSFWIPPAFPEDMERLLRNHVAAIFDHDQALQIHWETVLRHYVVTPRDVRLLISAEN